MGINRRNFFKVLGLTGAALTLGRDLRALPPDEKGIDFRGVLYDSVRCKGCHGCEFDCADANGLPVPGPVKEDTVLRDTTVLQRTVVNGYKTSKGVVYMKKQCMHCNEPACVSACLTNAMHKTKAGPVVWDPDKCMGCRYCMVSCPFDIPRFEYSSPNPQIQKCDMCIQRLKAGEPPACVFNCPNEALIYGTRRQLLAEAHKRIIEEPEKYVDNIYGEHEAGGTCWLYLSPVPFTELGLRKVSMESYPGLTKGFLYSVPSIFVLLPAFLTGVYHATRNRNSPSEEKTP